VTHHIRRRGVPSSLVQQHLHQQRDQLMETHHGAVARLNATAPSLPLDRPVMDLAVERARLTDAIAGGTGPATRQTGPEGRI
jgi:hypothetical protein